MFENREGKKIPDCTFRVRSPDGQWKDVSTKDLFAGKRVVVFALPGAFTPTCSSAHVPRYDELAPSFRSQGIDDLLCVSVNDTFVMNAWRTDQRVENVTFVPDGNGEFTRAMGMLVDKDDLGFGARSWRYSMLVNDGTIEKMFIEPDKPGDPFEVSDADTMLTHLGGDRLPDVAVFTKPGCSHCSRAKRMLDEAQIPYVEIGTTPRILAALPGGRSTPQVFVNGQHVGGADQLAEWLAKRE